MNVRPLLILPAALAALLAPVAASDAAVKRTSYPEISKIAPMQLAIGETLTITGRNFVPGRDKNTVVFKRDKQRAIFAKAANASSRKLTVVVPEKLRPFLAKNAEAADPHQVPHPRPRAPLRQALHRADALPGRRPGASRGRPRRPPARAGLRRRAATATRTARSTPSTWTTTTTA